MHEGLWRIAESAAESSVLNRVPKDVFVPQRVCSPDRAEDATAEIREGQLDRQEHPVLVEALTGHSRHVRHVGEPHRIDEEGVCDHDLRRNMLHHIVERIDDGLFLWARFPVALIHVAAI